jgi:predicted transcriptional regulator
MSVAQDLQKIVAVLEQAPAALPIRELAGTVGRSARAVGQDVDRLERQGRVRVHHPGKGYNVDGQRRVELVRS